MAKSDAQRRALVRVDDHIDVSHRLVTKAEFDTLSQKIINRSSRQGSLESIEGLLESAGRNVDGNSPTWKALLILDKKLDFIISELQTKTQASDIEFFPSDVNISGSGIRFASRQLYKKGDLVWIVMRYPTVPVMQVEAIGVVTRLGASIKSRTETPSVQVSIQYEAINEQDREEILRYTFQRQRVLLRSQRDT
ncbi:MAG: PilZ domain-containing protein [bacterium]|nr:PilZ domain-containing protein [bacterium]